MNTVGSRPEWGIISQHIPGRVGYTCSAAYRKFVDRGEIEDPNYIFVNVCCCFLVVLSSEPGSGGNWQKATRHTLHRDNKFGAPRWADKAEALRTEYSGLLITAHDYKHLFNVLIFANRLDCASPKPLLGGWGVTLAERCFRTDVFVHEQTKTSGNHQEIPNPTPRTPHPLAHIPPAPPGWPSQHGMTGLLEILSGWMNDGNPLTPHPLSRGIE